MSGDPHPFYPIIYVRGYAMTPSEIAATVATPYMGFNLGSTKVRQDWTGNTTRHIFESPLVRLMKDYGYRDIYADGTEIKGEIPAKSVIIYRYYEQADRDIGDGEVASIPEAARGLRDLIYNVRNQVCGSDAAALNHFRVYLVAHSMGGLVCRCFLQNDNISTEQDRDLVDKVFTYATPHNGIEMLGMNVPGFLGLWDINNFNRDVMADYLGLDQAERIDTLDGKYEPNRFFCLVGTNHKDYEVAMGASSALAGETSDGLVMVENATVQGAPRAFVYRSHSGPYGIVNSEEGYQNLTRFLFGNVRVDGFLEVEDVPLPPSVEKTRQEGQEVRASYYFESTVSPRGAMTYKLSERRIETHSAILRKYDEMFKPQEGAEARWPFLFSVYLDTKRITVGKTLVFTIDLAVSSTGYEIDGWLMFNRHIPGEYLFRETLTIRATQSDDGWTIRYNLTDEGWGEQRGREIDVDDLGFYVPLKSKKGFLSKLRLSVQT